VKHETAGRKGDQGSAFVQAEVAAGLAFLASQDASYIIGVEINVDGGAGQI
jgi:NAD(P)-dependent dehydrogenase (short-subunit alcohol dehydrogenase family)